MKCCTSFITAVLSVALSANLSASEESEQVSPEAFEKMIKAAAEKSINSKKELYRKYLPKAKDLGTGWLLPWELPESMREFASEEEYWQMLSGAIDKGDKAFFGAITSALLQLSPEDKGKMLDMFLMAAKELPKEEVPEGLTPEQFVFGTIMLMVNWDVSPSLAKKMEQVFGFLEEMQKIAGELMARRQLGLEESGPRKSQNEVMMELVTKPLKGKTGAQIRQEILDWAAAVRQRTVMTYTTCDNWEALLSGKEEDMKKAHLRHAVVAMTVLDRDRMAQVTDDLQPERAKALQQQFNQRLADFNKFFMELMQKKRTEELQKEIAEETSANRRSELQEELAKLPQALAELKKAMPKVEVEVYTRAFGDNCYVINMKGDINLPELTMSATNLQSSLRNGNAVVFVGLGGNYTPETLKKELDLFLSEMDARTAFFRE